MKPRFITIVRTTIKVPGFHNWENCNIEEVMFLKGRHRHVFEITVGATVTHADRDVEFFVLQRDIRKALLVPYYKRNRYDEMEFGSSSCEMIARKLSETLTEYGYTLDSIVVSEDGESEAEIRFIGGE